MTLTTRLLVFFLLMLGVVLIGFSTALYLLADNYLHRQVNDRLETVLHTVSSAIESGSEGVEWEPVERQQSLQPLTLDDDVAWIVGDGAVQIVARSNGGMTDRFLMNRQQLCDSMALRTTFGGGAQSRGKEGCCFWLVRMQNRQHQQQKCLTNGIATWSQHPRFKDIEGESAASQPVDVRVQPILLGELLDILGSTWSRRSRGRRSDFEPMEARKSWTWPARRRTRQCLQTFCRSPDSRRRGIDGVGLGLSIAKRLAESFGGDLMVEGERQHGCCFRVSSCFQSLTAMGSRLVIGMA